MALIARATQEFVPIKEVRDGIVVLKDGSLKAIVLANSINLSLKSEDEQKATIYQFQSFLNTLDFPIQIVIQSKRLDIRPYLLLLENRMKAQTEPLLKIQTKEYMEFIRNFTETTNIMTKNFFIVVPYSAKSIGGEEDVISRMFSKKRVQALEQEEKLADFEEKRSQLDQRVGVIEQGLARCGIKSVELGTEEVIEVFYKVFNPGEVEGKINLEQR
jgi:hypothetical protein